MNRPRLSNAYVSSRLLVVLGMLFCSLAISSPVAMVTDIAGTVNLAEAGKSRPAALLASLEPGTSLRLAAGARLVLSFLSKPLEVTLTGPAQATLEAEGVNVTQGAAASIRSLDGARADAARKFAAVPRDRVGLATVQMRSIVLPRLGIVGPSDTAVYSASPVLAWTGLPEVTRYHVVISDAFGKTIHEQTVAGTSLALEHALGFGASYTWRVEAKLPSGEVLSSKASFSVLDAERAKRTASLKPVAGAPFSDRLLFAAQLHSEGLAYEAKREWRALAQERPEDPVLRQLAER